MGLRAIALGSSRLGWEVLDALSTNQGVHAVVFAAVPELSIYAMMGGAFAVIVLIASQKRRMSDD